VAAALGEHLVFKLDAGSTGTFIEPGQAGCIERAAMAVVAVGDQRRGEGRGRQRAHPVGHFRRAHKADIGDTEAGPRNAKAGHVDTFSTCLCGNPGRQGVIGPRGENDALALQAFCKGFGRGGR